MVKFREASPGAAYEIAVGVTDAEEASKLGLAVVESLPMAAPPLMAATRTHRTVARSASPRPLGDTEVVAGGDGWPGADTGHRRPQKGRSGQPGRSVRSRRHGDESIHARRRGPGTLADETDEMLPCAKPPKRASRTRASPPDPKK
jgi:hypothetical protein